VRHIQVAQKGIEKMNINIRTAVIEDCERIRPLQKEIADLHHNGSLTYSKLKLATLQRKLSRKD
jgi:hypothetical protein